MIPSVHLDEEECHTGKRTYPKSCSGQQQFWAVETIFVWKVPPSRLEVLTLGGVGVALSSSVFWGTSRWVF